MQKRPGSSSQVLRNFTDNVRYHIYHFYHHIIIPVLWVVFYPIIMPWMIATKFITGIYDVILLSVETTTMYLRISHKFLKSVEENPPTASSIEKLLLSIVTILRRLSDNLVKHDGPHLRYINYNDKSSTSSDGMIIISPEKKHMSPEKITPEKAKVPSSPDHKQ